MRTAVAGLAFILLMSVNAFAIGNIYLEGIGAGTQTTDAKNELGFGGSIAYQVTDEFNVFFRNITSSRSYPHLYLGVTKYKDEFSYMMNVAGLEYLFNIKGLPIYWTNAFAIGSADASIKSGFNGTDYTNRKDDKGLCVAFWTGIMYVFTQNISGFVDVGYHKAFYFDELKDNNIMGAQVLFGIRFAVWGHNKSIYSEY